MACPASSADIHLSVVAPVYNESAIIEQFVEEVREALLTLEGSVFYEIVLVDDGSTDGSAGKLAGLAKKYLGEIKVIHLARNFGHDAAVSAGLDHSSGHAVIVMDSDLQDDPVAFSSFVEKWREGYDVVFAIRSSRQENWLQRTAFKAFYRFLCWISNTRLPVDAGNFSLLDRRVVATLQKIPERNRYFPGLRAWVGYQQVGVPVARRRRYDRRSRVGLRGLWKLSMNAIFSFSYVPIFIFRIIGVTSILLSIIFIFFALYHKIIAGKVVTAWASQLISASFFGGVNLFGLSVIGEYVARIYDELKRRPLYVVGKIIEKRPTKIEE